jgi:DNA-binding transcriptional ArsR family regulator
MANDDKAARREAGRFAYEGLERAIHEKARLGILASLMTRREGILFTELKELCSLTDGNLNRHLKVLQDARLVEVWKGNQKGKPQTLCRLTPQGRERFLEYVAVLEQVVSDAAAAAKSPSKQAARDLLRGWSPA